MIIDEDCIVDMNQGLPLYYFKAGMSEYPRNTLYTSLDHGFKFSTNREHFMIKGKVYMTYSYMALILLESTIQQGIRLEHSNYDQT